jgi:hypothetical protein
MAAVDRRDDAAHRHAGGLGPGDEAAGSTELGHSVGVGAAGESGRDLVVGARNRCICPGFVRDVQRIAFDRDQFQAGTFRRLHLPCVKGMGRAQGQREQMTKRARRRRRHRRECAAASMPEAAAAWAQSTPLHDLRPCVAVFPP